MDEILELINLDMKIQENLFNSHENKVNLKKKIEAEKKEISEYLWSVAKEKVSNKKAEYKAKIKDESFIIEKELEKNIELLEKSFNDNTEKWTKEIVERCLKSKE